MDHVITEAVTPLARLRGLALRRSLAPGHGLLLRRCRSVHTIGMRFALDLVWLDGAGRPVRVDAAVPPWRVRGCRAAHAVVELAAGGAAAYVAASAGVPPALCSSSPVASSGGCPSWPSSEASRPNSSPTVQSVTSRARRPAPGIWERW
jgi:uncharacterized protein